MTETIGVQRIKPQNKEADEEIQVVEFLLGEDKFAINLFDVKEIVEYTKITPLPGSSEYIKGIIDLRGEITTIIDLKARMKISSSNTGLEQLRIIVIDNSVTKSKTGILVDDVTTVLSVNKSQIDYSTCNNSDDTYILGVIKNNASDRRDNLTELLIWIDISGILRDIG